MHRYKMVVNKCSSGKVSCWIESQRKKNVTCFKKGTQEAHTACLFVSVPARGNRHSQHARRALLSFMPIIHTPRVICRCLFVVVNHAPLFVLMEERGRAACRHAVARLFVAMACHALLAVVRRLSFVAWSR